MRNTYAIPRSDQGKPTRSGKEGGCSSQASQLRVFHGTLTGNFIEESSQSTDKQ